MGRQRTFTTSRDAAYTQLPRAVFKAVVKLTDEGLTPTQVAVACGIDVGQVKAILDTGGIVVRWRTKAKRCPSCGHRVLVDPCLACELRGVAV